MTTSFSTFTLEALVQVISGGPGLGNNEPPIGLYRSASEIDGFLMACGIDTARSEGSRRPALRGCIHWAARQENGEELIGRAIEKVADPRNHAREPGKTQAVLDHLNMNLAADGFEVALFGGRAGLTQARLWGCCRRRHLREDSDAGFRDCEPGSRPRYPER